MAKQRDDQLQWAGNGVDAEMCTLRNFSRGSKAPSQSFVNVLKLISFPQTIARIVKNQLPCSKEVNEISAKVHMQTANTTMF